MEIPTGQTGGMGPPITYMLDNKQYVAVAGGRGLDQGGGGIATTTSGASSRLRLRPRRQSAEADGDRSELEGELLYCCVPVGVEVQVEGFRAKAGGPVANGRSIKLADGRELFSGGSAPAQ